jgi:hypothetical protein
MAGVEPAFSAPVTDTRFVAGFGYMHMARRRGFEPRSSRLRTGHPEPLDDRREVGSPTRTRTWIPRLTAGRPADWTIGNELVETVGNAPTATILQGSSALLCCPRRASAAARPNGMLQAGAQGRFRAHLSASSARRFHQISFLGEVGAGAGTRTRTSRVALLRSAGELRPQAAWWAGTELNGHSTEAGRLQRLGLANAQPARNWSRAAGSHRAVTAYEAVRITNRSARKEMAES